MYLLDADFFTLMCFFVKVFFALVAAIVGISVAVSVIGGVSFIGYGVITNFDRIIKGIWHVIKVLCVSEWIILRSHLKGEIKISECFLMYILSFLVGIVLGLCSNDPSPFMGVFVGFMLVTFVLCFCYGRPFWFVTLFTIAFLLPNK